jgi:micrococcal nuclease
MSTIPQYIYNSEVVRVVDGDTIIANVDVGFDMWKRCNIRLYGINTPETRTRNLEEKAMGYEAKDRLIELLKKNENKFVLESKGLDKYGRSLGVIWTGYHEVETYADTSGTRPVEISLNDLLVQEGLATEYFGGKR